MNKNIFVASTGNPVSPGMPGVVFRRVWTRAGLEWPQAGKRPRPYDFRHRFAFANIERWTRDGVDVMAMLPYLAAYMGHAGIDSTLYYVHCFASMFVRQVRQCFSAVWADGFPRCRHRFPVM